MSVAQADIEHIVREVMAQLGASSRSAAAPSPVPAAPVVTPLAASPQHGELHINCRVVTLESLIGRLNGLKRLVVAPGALVAPSVRDELRRRGAELVQESAGKKTKQSLAPVLLIAGRTGHDPEMAVQTLRQEGLEVQSESADCLIKATRTLAAAIAMRSLGILWTRHTAIGLCLANRHAALRAVLASNVAATAAAVNSVGANLLVIDPTIGTMYEKKQVLRDFCLGGIRECPEALKEILELRT